MTRILASLPAGLILALTLASAASADHNNSLTIAATPPIVTFGQSTDISGEMRGHQRGGRTVVLQGRKAGSTVFSSIRTTTTSANGDYRFANRFPDRNTTYRVRAGSVTSPEALVRVRIRVTLGVSDTTPVAGDRVRFSGRACPPHDGVWARIQRRTAAGTFATVSFVRLVDDPARPGCSKYNRLVRVGADGVYRASVPGDADHLAGASGTRTIVVH